MLAAPTLAAVIRLYRSYNDNMHFDLWSKRKENRISTGYSIRWQEKWKFQLRLSCHCNQPETSNMRTTTQRVNQKKINGKNVQLNILITFDSLHAHHTYSHILIIISSWNAIILSISKCAAYNESINFRLNIYSHPLLTFVYVIIFIFFNKI